MNGLDAAYRALEEAGHPLNYREITRQMLRKGLWHTTGQTPDYTVSRDLSQDIHRHGVLSRFLRVQAGLYGLSRWGLAKATLAEPSVGRLPPAEAPRPVPRPAEPTLPADLASVIAAWPSLPSQAKQEILLIAKRANGDAQTRRDADPVLAQLLPDGPKQFPADFLPPEALSGVKENIELPDEPIETIRLPDGSHIVRSQFGFAWPARNDTEGRYVCYAHLRSQRFVVVPTGMIQVFKAVKAYEKYLDGLWQELYHAYGRKFGDCSVADRRTRDAFESLGLPAKGRPELRGGARVEPEPSVPKPAKRGERTPEVKFYRPILEVLAEMGGAAKVSDILARLIQKMNGILTETDLAPLPKSGFPRWDNTARWARNSMVRNGLLKPDAPWGMWEISDKGRRFLRNADAL